MDGLGLQFTESMAGYLGPDRAAVRFDVQIHIADLARFLRVPGHAAELTGVFTMSPLGGTFPIRDGRFNLFTVDPHTGVRQMTYSFRFTAGDRGVIFHHGHLIESTYHLMPTAASLIFSDHQVPTDVYNLEAENFAWIDCFWSTMGRAGKVGTEIDRIYEASSNPQSLQKLSDALAHNLARKYDLLIPFSDWLEEKAYQLLLREAVVKRVAGQQERQLRAPLSEDAAAGLRWYLEGPVRNQMQVEHGGAPSAVTFVFGHTHKPFAKTMDLAGSARGVKVLNTGGWVLDTPEPRPEQGGAVVLIDEDLNAVNLRFYLEGQYTVCAEEPLSPGQGHSALFEHVNSILRAEADLWRSFSETACREAAMRVENFKRRVKTGTAGP